jgi:hypothetical protein
MEFTEDSVNEHRITLELYLICDMLYIDIYFIYNGCQKNVYT